MFFAEQLAYPTPITDYLYLGSVDTLENASFLKEISYVISVMKNPPVLKDKQQLIIPIEDSKDVDITIHFASVFKFIQEARANNKKILIHCEKGMSRSASFAIAWLLFEKNNRQLPVEYLEELNELTKQRSLVSPNAGFSAQLTALATELNSKLCNKMTELNQNIINPTQGYSI